MKIITVGQIIKESRSKFGYSTSELAKLVNVKTLEINKIESGKYTFPNPKILNRLSKVLKLEYSDLMYASGLGDLVSPLNFFVLEYYNNLKVKDIESTIHNISSRISENNKIIKHLKNAMNDFADDEYHSILNEDIDNLEYENNSSKEIIKFLKSRLIREQYLKNKLTIIDRLKNYIILSRDREV